MAYRKASNKRKTSAYSIIAGLICLIVCVFVISSRDSGILKTSSDFDCSQSFVRVFDVGQGDSALIYSNGYSALIDTGTSDSANNLCMELKSCNIKEIDVLLLTHLHADHTGGVSKIAELFGINNVILPEISIESEGLTSAELIINKVTESGGGVFNAKPGMNFKIGEFELTVLAAYGSMPDENNRSVMTMAKIGDKKFFFTGDAEAKAEKALLGEGLNLKCDVFMAGHHGSSTANTEELLNKMKPEYAVVSAGEGNMYGHPHKEVLSTFEHIGAKVLRTDYNGDITFYISDGKLNPKTEK